MAVLHDPHRLMPTIASAGWRIAGGLSYATSGGCFLIGLRLLYDAEGPDSPDVQRQLAHSAGRALFTHTTSVLCTAAVLAAVGTVALHSRLWSRSPSLSALAVLLTGMAATILVAVLSMQFGLVAVGHDSTAANEAAFHTLAVFEHAAADVGGWTSWALLATSTLLTSTTLHLHRAWKVAVVAGALAAGSLPVLYALGSSYLFMLPFGLWQLLIAGHIAVDGLALNYYCPDPPSREQPVLLPVALRSRRRFDA